MAHTNLGKAANTILTATEVNCLVAVDGSGQVGIGIAAAGARLQVDETTTLGSTAADFQIVSIMGGDVGNTFKSVDWLVRESNGSDWTTARMHQSIAIDASHATPGTDTKVWWERDPSSLIQSWGNAGDTWLTLNAGDCGVGTTLPGARLDVEDATATGVQIGKIGSTTLARAVWFGALTEGAFIQAAHNDTFGTEKNLVLNPNGGNVSVGNAVPGADFDVDANADTLSFRVDRSGSTATNRIAVFVSDNGGANTTNCQIMVDGDLENTNNAYGAISDEKLKENIVDATPKLDDLMKVKIRNFNLKRNPEVKQIGVIAQELEKVFPKLVKNSPDKVKVFNDEWEPTEDQTEEDRPYTMEKNGEVTKSVKYSVFVPMLIKAIQELSAEVELLKSKIP